MLVTFHRMGASSYPPCWLALVVSGWPITSYDLPLMASHWPVMVTVPSTAGGISSFLNESWQHNKEVG